MSIGPRELALKAEVERLRSELADSRGDATNLQNVIDELRGENAEYTSQYDGFASDAVNDVDYWRLKARDHWDAYRGCESELNTLKAENAELKTRQSIVLDLANESITEEIEVDQENIRLKAENGTLRAENALLRELVKAWEYTAQCAGFEMEDVEADEPGAGE